MLSYILNAVGIIVVVLVIIVATRPDNFRVTRSTVMSAPPAVVFAQVNDFHKWEAWSPWARLDPNAKNSFEGAPSGSGAAMKWEGNCKVGVGCMTITESKPGELIRFRLDFEKPMKATNTAEFTFKPEGNQTVVTWSMAGTNNFVGKFFGLIMGCDKMIGGQFEKGLAAIKSVAEAAGKN